MLRPWDPLGTLTALHIAPNWISRKGLKVTGKGTWGKDAWNGNDGSDGKGQAAKAGRMGKGEEGSETTVHNTYCETQTSTMSTYLLPYYRVAVPYKGQV